MKSANKHFVGGVVLAIFTVAAFGNGFFQQLFAGSTYGRLPRELRLGQELGLCSYSQCTKKILSQKTSSAAFTERLYRIFTLLGVKGIDKKSDLVKKGIVSKKSKKSFTRGDAFETLARAALYLKDCQMIDFSGRKAKNYSDFKILNKYREAASYLQGRYIAKGYPNGSFGKNRVLNLRDSLFFLYRFYEAVSADQMGKRPAESLCFIDIPTGHSIMEAIKNITKAGGFDRIILRASFDGESVLTAADLLDITSGIFAKANAQTDKLRLKNIFADCGTYCKRKHLALTLEYMLDVFAGPDLKAARPNYEDVDISQPLYRALVKLSGYGISMGYSNRFAANEYVTRFEAVSMINKVLKLFAAAKSDTPEGAKIAKANKPANKTDVEEFKMRLKAKKDKIHRILTQKS